MSPVEGPQEREPARDPNGHVTHGDGSSPASKAQPRQPAHQRFVFTDPAAFRYLEEDPSTTVLERHRRLVGYELYIVEQWACSRVHPTFVITTYTGIDQHSVLVSVLSVPTDEEQWSPRLRVYFKAITKYHARKKDTHLGTLMVTNLSGFPSALTVILVPNGNLKQHREDFIVNEDLKRMGCAGRAGLTLSYPVQATESKFARQYRTSDRIPLYSAVIELVKLCQAALMLFGKLAPEYADGLLCDVTERAINDWWTDIGAEIYNVEPSDGILGPTTVAALIGLLIGARNRLHACGSPVAKDVYDLACTKRGIGHFQKSHKVDKTRRLDRETLQQLHRVTAKAAKSSEGWNVPRAVKSTMAELSGKGHDLAVGEAREKAGIAEIESLDIETFVQLASGERSKWLWYGKPRKSDTDVFKQLGGEDGMVLENDEQGGYVWSRKHQESVVDEHPRSALHRQALLPSNSDGAEKDQARRRAVLKSVTGRMTDARSGLGRIRDAVGMRGHHHRLSKEANSFSDGDSLKEQSARLSDELFRDPDSAFPAPRRLSCNDTPSSPRSRQGSSLQDSVHLAGPSDRIFDQPSASDKYAPWETAIETDSEGHLSGATSETGHQARKSTPRVATFTEPNELPTATAAVADDSGKLQRIEGDGHQLFGKPSSPRALQRIKSQPLISRSITKEHYQYRWPRHLSYSNVVDVVSANDDFLWSRTSELDLKKHADSALVWEKARDEHARRINECLSALQTAEGFCVEERVGDIEAIDAARGRDQEILDTMYRQKFEEHNALKEATQGFLAEEKTGLEDAAKDLEILGAKLEYELNTLESKVEDVENAVTEFEMQVVQVESRAAELRTKATGNDNWLWWPLSIFFDI
ncbi:MAG: hypothetical protein Q9219_006366 [cf. Caloplaca sp. 3 TL-2023]